MKRLICILAALIILSAVPGNALGAPSGWTLAEIPESGGDGAPVFFDTNYHESDITIDINNNLYVMSGSKIIRFTPDGKADTSWGKNGIIYDGELEAENCEMLYIAVDSRGYVYAGCRICVDGSPTFIKRYTPEGEADRSWYGDGIMGGKFSGEEIVVDEAETAGGIRNQNEIALDSKDNLYVLYDRQVYKFLPNGAPDKKWRKVKMVQPQYEYDGVWYSNAMRIDRGDNVYLFNGNNRMVSKYSSTGRSLKSQKCPLYYPYGEEENTQYLINQAAFDNEGNIYNINQDGNSISKYSPKYKLDSVWCGGGIFTPGKGTEPVQTITDFETDTSGNIYILDGENGVVSKYTNDGNLDRGWGTNGSIGSVNSDGIAMLSITDIVSDTDGNIYALSDCLSDGNAIIVKINRNFTLDIAWGADMSGIFKGHKTDVSNSIAAYNRNLYVEPGMADTGVRYNGLIRLDSKGIKDPEWKVTSNGPVWDLQTDGNGCIYVAGSQITKYLPDGNVDESWGLKGSVDGVGFIGEMAVDSDGCLYISSRSDNYIVKYTPEGHLDTDWGVDGKTDIPGAAEDSAEYYTYFIAVDSAGNLYLSDYLNNRILRYNSEGRIDTSWCSAGEWESPDNFSDELAPMIRPTHLMIYDGRLYAIWNDRLYVMDDSIAQVGIKPPQVSPFEPTAEAAVSSSKTLTAWQWALCIGTLLFCAGAVLAIFLLVPKKKNTRRRMTKIKSIKIAKR